MPRQGGYVYQHADGCQSIMTMKQFMAESGLGRAKIDDLVVKGKVPVPYAPLREPFWLWSDLAAFDFSTEAEPTGEDNDRAQGAEKKEENDGQGDA